ncbi:uncharacterized protein [Pyrus communis]|uniref:uncharacterized protein n=1 Tax=Pyrus communis TaxID=23211 RepID=UPI0035C04468
MARGGWRERGRKNPIKLCCITLKTVIASGYIPFPYQFQFLNCSPFYSIPLYVLHCSDDSRGGGGGADFVAGFVLGGAVFGTLAYVFAPQIRRSLLNEDEYGFRKARRPIYYDEGLEKTRQTLNAKISQLNSAIDNVSSRLRGGNNDAPTVPIKIDPEVEATM